MRLPWGLSPARPAVVTEDKKPGNNALFWSAPVQLLALAILLVVLRLKLIGIPMERDEGEYAILGKLAMEGLAPYRDFYEMKPPFLFYTYGLLVKIFGYSHAGLHWAALFLSLVNTVAVYFIAGAWLGASWRFLAGLTIALLLSNPYSTAIFLESELVVMAFVLPGLYCLLRALFATDQGALSKQAEALYLTTAGFLIMAGVLVKQSGIFFLGFVAVALVLRFWFQGKERSWALFFAQGAWFSLGVFIAVALCMLILQVFGVWKEFWFWNVEYIRLYSSTISGEKAMEALSFGFSTASRNFVILWVAGALGLIVLWGSKLSREKQWLLLALAVFSFAAVAPGRRFYHHYWLHLLPALALLVTAFFYTVRYWMEKAFSAPAARVAAFGLAGVALAMPVLSNARLWSAPNYSRLMTGLFPGNPFVENKTLADYLGKRIQPGEEIAVLGSETPYFVYLDRMPLSRHFYMAFLSRPTEFSEQWQQEALDTLVARKPEYVVFNFIAYSWMVKPNSSKLFYDKSYEWCMREYEPIGWVFYRQKNRPEVVLDETARNYSPPKDGTPFVMLMQRKKTPSQ